MSEIEEARKAVEKEVGIHAGAEETIIKAYKKKIDQIRKWGYGSTILPSIRDVVLSSYSSYDKCTPEEKKEILQKKRLRVMKMTKETYQEIYEGMVENARKEKRVALKFARMRNDVNKKEKRAAIESTIRDLIYAQKVKFGFNTRPAEQKLNTLIIEYAMTFGSLFD